MPAQLPAGGPGAEAPREQPASPTTDDAPPPAKQEYTGAQGAEIAGSADSASAGPGASDSLCCTGYATAYTVAPGHKEAYIDARRAEMLYMAA